MSRTHHAHRTVNKVRLARPTSVTFPVKNRLSIMAKSKELKNIASGLYGSFISRNNDVRGYWGVGKLCLAAQ